MSRLTDRLRELSRAVADGDSSEFTMRIPAEPERDPDIVLSEAASRLDQQAVRIAGLEAALRAIVEAWDGDSESMSDDPAVIAREALRAERETSNKLNDIELCDDCPPLGYPTDKTRCAPCPRRSESGDAER